MLAGAVFAVPVLVLLAWRRWLRPVSLEPLTRWFLAWLLTLLQLSASLAVLGFTGLLQPWVAVGLNAAAAVLLVLRAAPVRPAPQREASPRADLALLWLVVLLALPIALRLLLYAAVLTPYSYDGVGYHLPPLVEALQNGRFVNSEAVPVWGTAYPKNVEMIFLWLLLKGTGQYVLFGQVLFVPLAGLALAVLARSFGASAALAGVAGLSVLFIPFVIIQAPTSYIDVATGAMLFSAVALAFQVRAGALPRRLGLWVTWAALGFLAGTKFNGPLLAFLVALLAFGPELKQRRGLREHLVGLCFALPFVLWYAANLVWFQNPLWPFAVPGLGKLFPATMRVRDIMVSNTPPDFAGRPVWQNIWQAWTERGPSPLLYTLDAHHSGLGPLWLSLWLPAIPFWLLKTWRTGQRWNSLLLAGLFAVLFLTSSNPWWARYTWWITGLGIVAWIGLWRLMPGIVRLAAAAVITAGTVYVLLFTSTQAWWEWPSFERALRGETALAIHLDPMLELIHSQRNATVAVRVSPWEQFYLYGADFSNRIVKSTTPDPGGLVPELRAKGATHLLLEPGMARFSQQAARDPNCFLEVAENAKGRVLYQFTCP